jgi:hypothetical protein
MGELTLMRSNPPAHYSAPKSAAFAQALRRHSTELRCHKKRTAEMGGPFSSPDVC